MYTRKLIIKITACLLVACLFLGLFLGLFYLVKAEEESYKYRIRVPGSRTYHTLSYERVNDCIAFTEINQGEQLTVCGNYAIEENPRYKN